MSTTHTAGGAGPTPDSVQKRDVRPFGVRDKIGYMFGDFGNDFTFILQSAFFMIFYTDVMGINPLHVGTVMAVARILDAFTDVGAGRLIDTMRPGKGGRFRPWILRIMLPVTVMSALMYSPFLADAAYGVRMAWMIVTYVLWGSVFYTLINIPYGSMASVISQDSADRASLSVFRSLGAALANLGINTVMPLVIFVNVAGQSQISGIRMFLAAAACSIFALICYLLCYANTVERIRTAPKSAQERDSFGKTLGALFRNRALTGLIVGSLFMLIGMMMSMGLVTYVYNAYFNNGQLLSLVNFVAIAPTLLLVPFGAMLAKKIGKKEFGVAGLSLAVLALLALFVLRTDSPWVYMAGYAVAAFGIACLNILIWAFITDAIDQQEINTGERNDATVYATYSWARKMGQAVAAQVIGMAMGWVGYQAGVEVQTEEVRQGIYLIATLVPAILLGIAVLALAFWYPLNRKRVEANTSTLELRRIQAGQTADDHR